MYERRICILEWLWDKDEDKDIDMEMDMNMCSDARLS